ncbi:MAG: acyl--CoA ligase, partial [Devosiaceae bacterium]|nr:acyl--CoA ligase [Devosiaceae bacterium]
MLFLHLQKTANFAPPSSGLHTQNQFISYGDLAEKVEHLAAGFLSLGIAKGARIAVFMPNGPKFFMITYALAAIGAIIVPVNEASGEAELEWLAQKCAFEAIISANNFSATATKLARFCGGNPPSPIIYYESGSRGANIIDLAKTPLQKLPDIGPDLVASYLLSSGSTGRPKLVPHTHGQLIACATIASTSLKLTPADMILNALPAHHAFGFLNGCFEVMSAGASTYYWVDPGPLVLSRKRFVDLLAVAGITVMPGVPYIFQTLGELRQSVQLPDLRLVYSSGIALKRPIFDAFQQRFNLTLFQGYGCTETGMIALNGAQSCPSPWDSVGRTSKGVKLSIRGGRENDMGIGELFVQTPALIDGYVDATPEQNMAFVDGGYLTGDLGRIDNQGNIFITGRTKLVIEVGGEKVDPLEVEDILCLSPDVAEAVVVGIPNPRNTEQRLKAFILRKRTITA